ncbi:GNAT family N-acetyltransferase [Gracilibacillus saliphilus]|uniref:GNAT family N-acetyltransferase n=1 Tax=Gracilibacillus saliphilus TaxID=543890 RepID=UPI0013D5D37D|nr:GNAT family N-acetyltransferase [Gracilibacillus saliphilus]
MALRDKIILEEISDNDINGLFTCYSNHEAMKSFGRKPIKTIEEATDILRESIKMKEEKTGVKYVAKIKDALDTVGFITLKRYNSTHSRAEIDYLVLPECQRKGVASKMVKLFLKDVANNWELERLTAYVDMDNYASARLLEKYNFVNEGILRSWVREGDEFHDVYSYRVLLSEWFADRSSE